MLARLENEGWVTSGWETSDPDARGPRKRIYEITVAGAEQARAALAGQRKASPRVAAARVKRPGLAGESAR